LVEVFQNAPPLFPRQCGLFSGGLDSFTWSRAAVAIFFRSPHQLAKAQCKCSLSADVTDRLAREALTLGHRRRTDPHSMTAFCEERQDMAAETNIVAE
jgi:hypothetical protein